MNLKNTFTSFANSRLLIAIFSLLSLASFYGCNDNDDDLEEETRRREEVYNRQLAADTVIIKEYIATHSITNAQRSPYKSGMFYAVQTPGTGDSALIGKTVVTHYVLRNLQGDTLDTSRKPRAGQTVIQPYPFILGDFRSQNSPIVGYQEGVSLMKVGEKTTFFLPSGLAYADNEKPNIPANSVLIFDIELLQIR